MTPIKKHAAAWLTVLRLPFYPPAWVAFALGALAAAGPGVLASGTFWLGFAVVCFLQAGAVLGNELIDLPADRTNTAFGPCNGGSRVLVEGRISENSVRAAIWIAVGSSGALLGLVSTTTAAPVGPTVTVFALLAALAIFYTLPPLKLCYRTLGEVDVALTHGPVIVLSGWVLAGGAWHAPLPWLLGLPIAFAAIPVAVLVSLPDRASDAVAGKWTVAARWGRRPAIVVALLGTIAAAACALGWSLLAARPPGYGVVPWLALPHAAGLAWLLIRNLRGDEDPVESRRPTLIALGYVAWFLLIPGVALVTGGH